MLTAIKLSTLLNTISTQDCEHQCFNYIDNLASRLKVDTNFCNDHEQKFIQNLFRWELNTDFESKHALTPIFCSGYEKYSLVELLSKCFDNNEITVLIDLSNDSSLNHEILARINDILWCFRHQNSETKKIKFDFARNAIKHYCIIASQKRDRDQAIARLVRAANIAQLIRGNKFDFPDDLLELMKNHVDVNDSSDNTLKILKILHKIKPDLKEELLKMCQSLIDSNYPTPKMNSFCLIAYYDFFITHTNDTFLKKLYQERKINSLLWFAAFEERKGHHPMALDYAIQAEKELKKLENCPEKQNLKTNIDEKKKNNSKLPQGMQWSNLNICMDNIQEKFKALENESVIDIIKIAFNHLKNINYHEAKSSLGAWLACSTILSSDNTGVLIHDERPELITYSYSELMKINSLLGTVRHQISIEIFHLFAHIENKNLANEILLLLEKFLINSCIQERKEIILNSVKYAFLGDICTALHLIIPQLEEFFRKKMQSKGHNPSVFTNENNIEELSMSQIFTKNNTAKILIDEYGHDIFCEFYLLLLDKRAGNYRNKISHGKMNMSEFNSSISLYVFLICFYAIFKEAYF